MEESMNPQRFCRYSLSSNNRRREVYTDPSSEDGSSYYDNKRTKHYHQRRRHHHYRRRRRHRLDRERRVREEDKSSKELSNFPSSSSSIHGKSSFNSFPMERRSQLDNFLCGPGLMKNNASSVDSGYASLNPSASLNPDEEFSPNAYGCSKEEFSSFVNEVLEDIRTGEETEVRDTLCSNCGLFGPLEQCSCESNSGNSQQFPSDKKSFPPPSFSTSNTQKRRSVGIVEPRIVLKPEKTDSNERETNRNRRIKFRKSKRLKRRKRYESWSESSEINSSDEGDCDSSSSSSSSWQEEIDDERGNEGLKRKKKRKYKKPPVSPLYLNNVVLSSHISSQSSNKRNQDKIPTADTHLENLEDVPLEDFRKTTDILQASISSLFDEPLPHVDELLTTIDLQPIESGNAIEDSSSSKSVFEDRRVIFTDSSRKNGAGEEWIFCQERGCTFWTRKACRMERHRACHLPDTKYYKCPDCPLKFYSLAKMLRHDRRIHTGVKEYECRVCDAEVTDIQIHMRIHKAEKQFGCHICPMQFRHKNSLVRHLCQHTGERPYPCSNCDCAFVSMHRLKEHTRKHHSCIETVPNIEDLKEKNIRRGPSPLQVTRRVLSSNSLSSNLSPTIIYPDQTRLNEVISLQSFPILSIPTSTSPSSSSGVFILTEPTKAAGQILSNPVFITSQPTVLPSHQYLLQTNPSSSPILLPLEASSHNHGHNKICGEGNSESFRCGDCGRGSKFENAHKKHCSLRKI